MPQNNPLSLTDVAAFWGTVTGTAALTVSYFSYKRDSVHIKVDVKKNWFAVGHPDFDIKENLVMVEVYNKGRRPVTIDMVAYNYLMKTGAVILPPLGSPRELFEGKSTRYLIRQTEVDDFSEISYFAAYDAVGNTYKKYVAPLYKRLFYWIIFASHLRKKEKPKK